MTYLEQFPATIEATFEWLIYGRVMIVAILDVLRKFAGGGVRIFRLLGCLVYACCLYATIWANSGAVWKVIKKGLRGELKHGTNSVLTAQVRESRGAV